MLLSCLACRKIPKVTLSKFFYHNGWEAKPLCVTVKVFFLTKVIYRKLTGRALACIFLQKCNNQKYASLLTFYVSNFTPA